MSSRAPSGRASLAWSFENQVLSLAELEKAWAEMAKMPAHKKFSKELAEHVVSGSNRWEILRIVDV